MATLSDLCREIIYSRLLIGWFLLLVAIYFIAEFIYVISRVVIIIRGSIPLSITPFSFLKIVWVSTPSISWWATELVSVYLDLLCLIIMIS